MHVAPARSPRAPKRPRVSDPALAALQRKMPSVGIDDLCRRWEQIVAGARA